MSNNSIKSKDLNDILVFWRSQESKKVLGIDFQTVEEVADFIGTKPYFIEKVLKGKTINGKKWKPNIFFKNLDDTHQIKFIVVYKDDWFNYSERQKNNRISKLSSGDSLDYDIDNKMFLCRNTNDSNCDSIYIIDKVKLMECKSQQWIRNGGVICEWDKIDIFFKNNFIDITHIFYDNKESLGISKDISELEESDIFKIFKLCDSLNIYQNNK